MEIPYEIQQQINDLVPYALELLQEVASDENAKMRDRTEAKKILHNWERSKQMNKDYLENLD